MWYCAVFFMVPSAFFYHFLNLVNDPLFEYCQRPHHYTYCGINVAFLLVSYKYLLR